jgi:2-(1,2-epoxy-1,2-dihydrophenyl)acetyl-CoA isomerase
MLRARGKAFCAGALLDDFPAKGERDAAGRTSSQVVESLMRDGGEQVVRAIGAFPAPVLCVVQGVATGGGVGIALAADVVVAARSAFFSLPFVPALALVPDMGATWHMQRVLGEARTRALALLGDRLSAEEAARTGLIWSCVDDERLASVADELAQRLAALPPAAAAEVRALLANGADDSFEEQLEYERGRQTHLMNQSAFFEGLAAFKAKRRPQFHPPVEENDK